MSRSPSDATRFTSTGPTIKSSPSFTSNTSSPPRASRFGPGPAGETPKQKVERLRAQVRAEKFNQNASLFDRLTVKGRIYADYAHRAFTYSLIGATGIAAVLTVFSITSLAAHNRRQRVLFIEREITRLEEAQKAVATGNFTKEQLELVEKEALADQSIKRKELEKAKQAERGYFIRAKEALLGPSEEPSVLELIKERDSPEGRMEKMKAEKLMDVPADSILSQANAFSNAPAAAGPGQIDQLAGNVADAVTPKKSWTSWITGR